MLTGPQPFNLRLDRPVGAGLRAGGLVSVQVLARLGGGRWSVSVQGRIIPASAEVELAPGARLLARVSRGGGRITLRVLGPAAEPEGQVPAAARVAAALSASGLEVRQETVQKVRRLLERLRLPPQRFARLAALLLEKGVDLDSPGIAALLENLAYGQSGSRHRGRPWPSSTQALAEELSSDLGGAGDGEAQPLPLFNHLQAGAEQWFVIPYRYGEVSGTLRLRRQAGARQADRLVLATDGPWSFVLSRRASGYALHAFCEEETLTLRARRGWRRLAQKLQNLGVETDDIIRGGDGFDGFSLPWEAGPYRRVDTEG
jgi:hypothetical protein